MNRILIFLTLLLLFTPKFAEKARAQVAPIPDIIINLACDKKPDMMKFVTLFPYPDTTITEWFIPSSGLCNSNYWKDGQPKNELCSVDTLRSLLGNSCNLSTPGVDCFMQDSSASRMMLHINPKSNTTLEKFAIHYALVAKSTMSNPQNKPNLAQKFAVKIVDDNGNILQRQYVSIPSQTSKDSFFWITFILNQDLIAGKHYHMYIFGYDPLYPNEVNTNFPIWETFGFKATYRCAGPQGSCNWDSIPKQIWRDPFYEWPCNASESWEWTSSCGDNYIAQYNFYDKEAPTIVKCPKDVTVTIPNGHCELNYVVPPVEVKDNCSINNRVIIETPYGEIDDNGGVMHDVRLGVWKITYNAQDICGNWSQPCSYNLTVKETGGFSLVCKGSTVVSLNDSCSYIPAKTFVIGTSGLCCPTYIVYGVRMDNGKGGLNVPFCCNDVGKSVVVVLTAVSDCDTLDKTSCMVSVTVQDKYVPRITCPPDITVDCSIYDPNKVDKPIVLENCLASLTRIDSVSIDGLCKTGKTYHTWTAIDYSGNSATCMQTITIVNTKAFSDVNIIWPRDTVLFECNGKYDPSRTGNPKFTFPGCSRGAASSFKDEVFGNFHKGGICKKILRTWKVLDWCNYPGPIWSKVQVIALMDSIKPIITFCPKDTSIGNFGACSDSVLVNLESVTATDCSGIFSITNDSQYAFAKGANATGRYPNGKHKITFIVSDSCGSTSTCAFTITVSDKKPPAPFCIDVITDLQYMPTMGVVQQVNVRKLVLKAEENCPNCSVTFSYDSLKIDTVKWFDCTNIGENSVCVWFTDCKGNQSKCCPKIIIQDNNDLCPHNLTIGGALSTLKNLPVKQVDVELNGKVYPFDDKYIFVQLKPGMKCKIKPTRNNEFLDGVTTADIVKIQRYVLGKENFTPYQLIAADVNNSGSITASDVSELRKLILGVIPALTNNTSWRFIPSDYVFPDPSKPYSFPDFRTYTIYQSELKADFIGIKIGDVNNTTTGNIVGGNLSGRSREDVSFEDFFKVSVSPTLATDQIQVSCPFYENAVKPEVEVSKADGSIVYKGAFTEKMFLDVSNLTSGVYFVRISSEGIFDTQKFIKK